MLGCHPMGAADCIMAVISDMQGYNMHNMHIKTQPDKYICRTINNHIANKREPKAIFNPPLRVGVVLYAPNMKSKWWVR